MNGGTFADKNLVQCIIDQLQQGQTLVLQTLLASKGSMPRHEGSRRVVWRGGCAGTVGGGAIERMADERSRALLETVALAEPCGKAAETACADTPERAHLNDALPLERLQWMDKPVTGMACGGAALLSLRIVTASDLPLFEQLIQSQLEGTSLCLHETWIDPTQPSWELKPYQGERLSWDAEQAHYSEPLYPTRTVHIFGAGHVGTALEPIARSLDFEVHLYDNRPEFVNPERFSAGTATTCAPSYRELAQAAQIAQHDFIVVLTQGHMGDADVLTQLLQPTRPVYAYVGCIGSRAKAATVRSMLCDAGCVPERVAAVHLPIGEPLAAHTPAEIAVSIAAQLINRRSELTYA